MMNLSLGVDGRMTAVGGQGGQFENAINTGRVTPCRAGCRLPRPREKRVRFIGVVLDGTEQPGGDVSYHGRQERARVVVSSSASSCCGGSVFTGSLSGMEGDQGGQGRELEQQVVEEVKEEEEEEDQAMGWWKRYREKSKVLREKLLALGPAAVLAYGLFDGVSYTIAFCIAFLGYEAKTGLNPTQNVADIVKICILMWAGNNVTRPFRLAGAAALAPFMEKLMTKLQKKLNLPNKIIAFIMLTSLIAAICLSIVGALFLSRLVQG